MAVDSPPIEEREEHCWDTASPPVSGSGRPAGMEGCLARAGGVVGIKAASIRPEELEELPSFSAPNDGMTSWAGEATLTTGPPVRGRRNSGLVGGSNDGGGRGTRTGVRSRSPLRLGDPSVGAAAGYVMG